MTSHTTHTTHIDALEEALKEAGFKARQWKGFRIYLNGYGRDIKAYIELDEPDAAAPEDLYEGCVLKVFSNAAQSTRWRVNRAKQVKHDIALRLNAVGITTGPVCEHWQDIIL